MHIFIDINSDSDGDADVVILDEPRPVSKADAISALNVIAEYCMCNGLDTHGVTKLESAIVFHCSKAVVQRRITDYFGGANL